MADDTLEISLGRDFYILLAIAALGSFGVVALLLLLLALPWPRRVDAEGIVTRGGRRHPWTAFERAIPLRRRNYRLLFRTGRVNVVPSFLANPVALVSVLRSRGITPP
jgi:hypothetical protein